MTKCLPCSTGELVENDLARHIVEYKLLWVHLGRDQDLAAALVRLLTQERGLLPLPNVLCIPGGFDCQRLLVQTEKRQ